MRRSMLVLALLSAVPVAAHAQANTPDPMMARLRTLVEQNPAELVLEHQRDLGLAAAQVTRLDGIGRTVREQNQQVLDAALKDLAEDPARPASLDRHRAFRMTMAQMARNLAAGREQVSEVLSTDQRQHAEELRRAARRNRR